MKLNRFLWINVWFGIIILGVFYYYHRMQGREKSRERERFDLVKDSAMRETFLFARVPDSLFFMGKGCEMPSFLRAEMLRVYYEEVSSSRGHFFALLRRYYRWKEVGRFALGEAGLHEDLLFLAISSGMDPSFHQAERLGFWALDTSWFSHFLCIGTAFMICVMILLWVRGFWRLVCRLGRRWIVGGWGFGCLPIFLLLIRTKKVRSGRKNDKSKLFWLLFWYGVPCCCIPSSGVFPARGFCTFRHLFRCPHRDYASHRRFRGLGKGSRHDDVCVHGV